MATRDLFRNELDEIYGEIIILAQDTGVALSDSMDALFEQDLEKARKIITNDREIDKKEMEINDRTVLLIAKQQPVASDLRRVITALKVLTDIERMGDNAKNIATATIELDEVNIEIPAALTKMHAEVQEMLKSALSAFQYEDVSIARKLAELDDEIDQLYKTVVRTLLSETASYPDKVQYIMQIAFCARYLERFGDHLTNIGESILYLVKGENFDLN